MSLPFVGDELSIAEKEWNNYENKRNYENKGGN